MSRKKLTLLEKEMIFCHKRLEQYWMLIEKKKLSKKKTERLKQKISEWENIIFEKLEKGRELK